MKKNSQIAPEYLIGIIIIAIVIFLLVSQTSLFGKEIKSNLPKQICKSSITTSTALHIKGQDFGNGITCPTQDILLTGTGDESKEKIANAMYDCWDQFGEGKLELFKGEDIYCHVCHRFRFEEKNKQLTDMGKYLYENNAPRPHNNLKYSDYLAGYKTTQAEKFLAEIPTKKGKDTLETSKIYSTLFVYAKGKDNIDNIIDATAGNKIKASAGLIAIGTVGGAALALTPVGWIGGALFFIGSTVTASYTWFKDSTIEWASMTVLTEYDADSFKQYKCKHFPISEKPFGGTK